MDVDDTLFWERLAVAFHKAKKSGQAGNRRSPVPWLADLLGVSEKTVYSWKNGVVPIPQYARVVLDLLQISERGRQSADHLLRQLQAIRADARTYAGAWLRGLEELEDRLIKVVGYDPQKVRFQKMGGRDR